jgi:hypothetical protein
MGHIRWGSRLLVAALLALLVSACARVGHSETVNVAQASAMVMAESQTVEISSTFSTPGAPTATSRMLYDYQHLLGEEFDQSWGGPSGQGQPDVIYEGSTVYLNNSDTNIGIVVLGSDLNLSGQCTTQNN